MTHFDINAAPELELTATEPDWLFSAYRRTRQEVSNPEQLLQARTRFLTEYNTIPQPPSSDTTASDTESEPNELDATPHWPTQTIPPHLNTAHRTKEEVLTHFPRYSARLLLEFKLLTPLITKDDDPFYPFDNPVRKDPIFRVPYLSAASVKHLSDEAFQRAIQLKNGMGLGSERALAQRLRAAIATKDDNETALRLFGINDEGSHVQPSSGPVGRLRFSPVWFKDVQFLPINPKKAEGSAPTQVEAIAPNPQENAVIEIIYFNPHGINLTNNSVVREDLANLLTALAVLWPVSGLGSKRSDGYGAIQIEKATLQAVDWSKIEPDENQKENKEGSDIPLPPSYYGEYIDDENQPITEEAFEAKFAPLLARKEQKVAQLDKLWRDARAESKGHKKTRKGWENAVKARDFLIWQERRKYQKVMKYWRKYGQRVMLTRVDGVPVVVQYWPLYEHQEEGPKSWLKLADWIRVPS